MRLKRFLSVLVVVGALIYASVALGVPREIAVDDDVFAPVAPPVRNLAAGPSFHWKDAPGANAGTTSARTQDAVLSGAPTAGAIDFSISASAGSYHYYCELHGTPNPGSIGMQGTVKVKPIANANPAGAPFTVTWALPGTNTGTRFDIRFRRGTTGAFTTWRNDTSARSGVFGQAGAPVTVAPGQTYQFQARSQKAPSQQSDWSPVADLQHLRTTALGCPPACLRQGDVALATLSTAMAIAAMVGTSMRTLPANSLQAKVTRCRPGPAGALTTVLQSRSSRALTCCHSPLPLVAGKVRDRHRCGLRSALAAPPTLSWSPVAITKTLEGLLTEVWW